MGTLLYVVLRLANLVDTPDDWIHICHFASIDSIAFVLLLHWWQRRGQGPSKSA